MDWNTVISIIAQVLTLVTILLVYQTLTEMKTQRKASQKPELIIPDVSITGLAGGKGLFIASSWSNQKEDGGLTEENFPFVTVYNIGAGAAKEINLKWIFDVSSAVESIQNYCYHHSIPLVVSIKDEGLNIEFDEAHFWSNIEAFSSVEHDYLMPASVTSEGLKSELPTPFLYTSSILIFLNNHYNQEKYGHPSLSFTDLYQEDAEFNIPPIKCELSYKDISGEEYKKKFNVGFLPFMTMGIPKPEDKIPEPIHAFRAVFTFKEYA